MDIFSKRLLFLPWNHDFHWSLFMIVRPILACLKHRGSLCPSHLLCCDDSSEAPSTSLSKPQNSLQRPSRRKDKKVILSDDEGSSGGEAGGARGARCARGSSNKSTAFADADASFNADLDNYACILYFDSYRGHIEECDVEKCYDQIVR